MLCLAVSPTCVLGCLPGRQDILCWTVDAFLLRISFRSFIFDSSSPNVFVPLVVLVVLWRLSVFVIFYVMSCRLSSWSNQQLPGGSQPWRERRNQLSEGEKSELCWVHTKDTFFRWLVSTTTGTSLNLRTGSATLLTMEDTLEKDDLSREGCGRWNTLVIIDFQKLFRRKCPNLKVWKMSRDLWI